MGNKNRIYQIQDRAGGYHMVWSILDIDALSLRIYNKKEEISVFKSCNAENFSLDGVIYSAKSFSILNKDILSITEVERY